MVRVWRKCGKRFIERRRHGSTTRDIIADPKVIRRRNEWIPTMVMSLDRIDFVIDCWLRAETENHRNKRPPGFERADAPLRSHGKYQSANRTGTAISRDCRDQSRRK